MNTEAIAKRLVELCREGKYEEAQRELYAKDAVSIEPDGLPPGMPGNVQGLEAIYEKGRQFAESIETMHGGSVSDPVIASNWFSVSMSMDVTMKGRPRMDMSEICLYRVHDGKIVSERFFYDIG
ncbi:SnoaL-like domain-containing protein [Dyella tabacisoli]|uniref:Nuclear transport factor 2 family protein n=1 Tax=Dyella tabacisoli TaxID=2282381 RepID=A0A369UN50_9GAMM|nr:SnoaL-like domain-containing protein [Dyella tabacisoli]RDD82194.1 nuclear transport factor 2 family protein [Dyella tabacisoli]